MRHPLCANQKRCLVFRGDTHLGLSVSRHETTGTRETDMNMKLMLHVVS